MDGIGGEEIAFLLMLCLPGLVMLYILFSARIDGDLDDNNDEQGDRK